MKEDVLAKHIISGHERFEEYTRCYQAKLEQLYGT